MIEKSDKDLLDFVCQADAETVLCLTATLNALGTFRFRSFRSLKSEADIPPANSDDRRQLATKMLDVFLYHSSNFFGYLVRKLFRRPSGQHYHDALRRSILFLNTQMAPSLISKISSFFLQLWNKSRRSNPIPKEAVVIPRVATVDEYELLLTETLLSIQFQGKTEDEIRQMLIEAGLDKEAAEEAAKKLALGVSMGGGIILLVKAVGKKAVKTIVDAILSQILTKVLSKGVAKKIVGQTLVKVTQTAIARFVSYVGWTLIAWDVFKLTGPTNRVIIPFTSIVAAIRTSARLDNGQE